MWLKELISLHDLLRLIDSAVQSLLPQLIKSMQLYDGSRTYMLIICRPHFSTVPDHIEGPATLLTSSPAIILQLTKVFPVH